MSDPHSPVKAYQLDGLLNKMIRTQRLLKELQDRVSFLEEVGAKGDLAWPSEYKKQS